MKRWELERDEREDGEMKNKKNDKNKQPSVILIEVLNKIFFFFILDDYYSAHL